jgi:hypothetical protein
LLALLPVFVAGGTFFMILHLNTTALTTWAKESTDRHSANVFDLLPSGLTAEDALPSYFTNADPGVPRPHRDTLAVVDAKVARMFGVSRMDQDAVAAARKALPDVRVVALDGEIPGAAHSTDPAIDRRAANVYPAGTVEVKEERDSHGVPVVSVSVPEGTAPVARVAFVRTIGEREVPVLLVDEATRKDVYAGVADNAPTLPAGEYLQITNAPVFQSANAACVILFTPLVVWFWNLMRRRGREVGTAHKIFYGLVLTLASMLLMAVAGWLSDGGSVKVSPLWLIGGYAVMTLGELCLSPMGLSLVTKLSPKRYVGLMMGGWFCATAFGNKLSGFFGGVQSLMSPTAFFLVLAASVGVVALGIRLILPKLDTAIRKYGA